MRTHLRMGPTMSYAKSRTAQHITALVDDLGVRRLEAAQLETQQPGEHHGPEPSALSVVQNGMASADMPHSGHETPCSPGGRLAARQVASITTES